MSITPIHDPLRTENQSREREQRLFAAIELGVIAQAAVDGHLDTDASSEELAVIIAEGQQATVQVWTLFLPMVWSMARPHARGRTSLDDLVGAGCIGLAEAIRRYDPSRGTRFSTPKWRLNSAVPGSGGGSAGRSTRTFHWRALRCSPTCA